MINKFESVKAMKVEQVTDLSSAFATTSNLPFHIFIAPGSSADLGCGDVMLIAAKPTRNDDTTTVPIVVGQWNPVIFDSIAANSSADTDIDLDYYSVFISEVENQ